MKLPFKFRTSHLAIAGLVIATSVIIVVTRNQDHTLGKAQTNQQSTTQTNKTNATDGSHKASTDTPGSSDSKQQNTASSDAKADAAPKPESLACDALTAEAAKRILGKQATSTKANDMSDLATTNTTLSSCAYMDGTTRLQVTVRTPNGNLGVSKNATVFGSDRPANAAKVDGLGQSAFWDPDTHRLNILHSNIWYIVDLGENSTQAAAETAASQLAVKL